MKKTIFLIFIAVFAPFSYAKNIDLSPYFSNKSGCFILYNINKKEKEITYDPTRCTERIPADSTFKIALSLMAFDKGLINQNTIFKWDGKTRALAFWNQNQTPKTWLENSVVWVSQQITPQLGLKAIQNYLKEFSYGNQDFSGDPGKNNGLTHAWLSSSLKISADEQLNFLKALFDEQLPVSKAAMKATKQNMYLDESHGWKLYGKTGSGDSIQKKGLFVNKKKVKQDGWFVGFLENGNQNYIFVLNFSDLRAPATREAGGTRAKKMAKAILAEVGLW